MDIVQIVFPLILVGGIIIFVIKRLDRKNKAGVFAKKSSQNAQVLLDSLIPLGMIFGSAASLVLSIIFPFPILSSISIGAAVGLLAGYFAYQSYGRTNEVSKQKVLLKKMI
ncbi:hypothetical protein SporoP33_01540 [Sporosarcina sp. P33]|nr:hypothetical protein SporoP33_01540 [Sporosarcina sp. P33]